jgi:hypothetical protein
MPTTGSTTFTTTVGMIYRVHNHTSYGWANTAPTCGTSLTQLLRSVFFITDLTNGSAAGYMNSTHFTRAQT